MNNYCSKESFIVSKEVKDALKLNDIEMKRRRFLIKKEKLSSNEQRELDILIIRDDLITIEFMKEVISSLHMKTLIK